MQATVFSFDPERHQGTVVSDDGLVLPFDAEAFESGGIRLLRPGQRVQLVRSADGSVSSLTIVTLGVAGNANGDPA